MAKEYFRNMMSWGAIPYRGNIIVYDNMEGTLKWEKTGTGSGFQVTYSDTYAYYGTKTMIGITRIASAAEDDEIELNRTFPVKPSLICEMSFYFHTFLPTRVKYYRSLMIYDDTVVAYAPGIRWVRSSGKWQYLDSAGSFQDITGAVQPYLTDTWHLVKMAFDFNTGKYIHLIADGEKFDLSAIAFQSGATSNSMYAAAYLAVVTAGANAASILIDDFAITEEPFF